MKFRKRVKIFPGFNLNFSGSGISATVGVSGANVNITKNGTYLNTGIPGTGFYDRQRMYSGLDSQTFDSDSDVLIEEPNVEGEIKSADVNKLTSVSLLDIKKSLEEVYNDRYEIQHEIQLTKKKISFAKFTHIFSRIIIVGFFIKSFKKNLTNNREYLIDLNEQLSNSVINIDVYFDKKYEQKYYELLDSYKLLMSCEIIWDITSSVHNDTKITRSAASNSVTRKVVKFKFDNIDIIKSSHQAFHFENKNGGDLFIYPAFVITTNNNREFALISLEDFQLIFSEQRFLEEERIPSDTNVIDKTWAKVNKNGSPDKRFKDNYEIPIVRYGEFLLKSKSGLNENYAFSNYEKSKIFANCFADYRENIR